MNIRLFLLRKFVFNVMVGIYLNENPLFTNIFSFRINIGRES